MSEITKLPAQNPRVETGPIQFGDDWPGVFIRGDEALFMAQYLTNMLTTAPRDDAPGEAAIYKKMLEGLRATLLSCSVGDTGWPP